MQYRMQCILAMAIIFFIASPGEAGHGHKTRDSGTHHEKQYDLYDMDFENGTLVLKHDDHLGEKVEITPEIELYINGRHISTDKRQRKLLGAFYHRVEKIEDFAVQLGKEGAAIGVEGAALAVKALAKVCMLLSKDYDSEDLERDMEIEAERIEAKATTLEEKAEAIEEWADDLEELADELRERIPELQELGWF